MPKVDGGGKARSIVLWGHQPFTAIKNLQANMQPGDLVELNTVRRRLAQASALHVFTCTSVDLDNIAFLDESRHSKLAARFGLCRLSNAGRCVALSSWLGLDHFQ